jgi:hypothetical protein
MAFQTTNGAHLYVPGLPFSVNLPNASFAPGTTSNTVMTSSNTSAKTAMLGRLYFDAKSGSKTIAKIHWRFGTTITAGTSAVVRVSVQGVSGGSKAIPDGTIASSGGATYTFNMTDTGVSASTWFTTPSATSFGTQPTYNYGDLLSFVWDWSAAGTGSVLTFSNLGTISGGNPGFAALLTTPDGTTWTDGGLPDLVIEFSDGTFGTIDGGMPISAGVSTSYGATSTAISYGTQFTLPYTAKCDAIWMCAGLNSGSTGVAELVNASSGAVIASVTIGNNYSSSTGADINCYLLSSEQTLSANTAYFAGLRATSGTTSGCTAIGWDMASPSYQPVFAGGSAFVAASRASSTAVPVTTNTRRYAVGVRLSAFDDGVSSGGTAGVHYRPNMTGNISG